MLKWYAQLPKIVSIKIKARVNENLRDLIFDKNISFLRERSKDKILMNKQVTASRKMKGRVLIELKSKMTNSRKLNANFSARL